MDLICLVRKRETNKELELMPHLCLAQHLPKLSSVHTIINTSISKIQILNPVKAYVEFIKQSDTKGGKEMAKSCSN